MRAGRLLPDFPHEPEPISSDHQPDILLGVFQTQETFGGQLQGQVSATDA